MMQRKLVVTRWVCPVCGRRRNLRFRPPDTPRCPHGENLKAVERPVDMMEVLG